MFFYGFVVLVFICFVAFRVFLYCFLLWIIGLSLCRLKESLVDLKFTKKASCVLLMDSTTSIKSQKKIS